MDRTLTRREMLILVSYASLEVSGTFSARVFASETALRKAFRRMAKKREIEPLRTAGRLYLESTPSEGNLASLLGFLPKADRVDGAYWRAFDERMRADFSEGETVSLESWVLSRSECRLYALLHLSAL